MSDSPHTSSRAPVSAPARPACWVVTQGAAGMENQALGLAEALGLEPTVFRPPKPPLHGILPPHWLRPGPLAATLRAHSRDGAPVADDPPRLVISCGHRGVAYAIALHRIGRGATATVHIQDPHVRPALFDIVAAPAHDGLHGANVIATQGALHRVTEARLKEAEGHFRTRFADLPRPLIAALVGGASRRYRMDAAAAAKIGRALADVARASGGSLLVTTSRRTEPAAAAALKSAVAGVPGELWDGSGENPYFGYLACADHIFVTCDSVTMTSEAVATGRPVHVVPLAGRGSSRFRRFFQDFVSAGFVRWFTGTLDSWDYTPPRETARVAALIRERLGDRVADL